MFATATTLTTDQMNERLRRELGDLMRTAPVKTTIQMVLLAVVRNAAPRVYRQVLRESLAKCRIEIGD